MSVSMLALALLASMPVVACIVAEGPDARAQELKEAAQDRALQRELAGALARQADTIVIAASVGDIADSLESDFRIVQVLKGAGLVGSKMVYRASPSIPPIACTRPSELFRNTATSPGGTYLLYVVARQLLRAKSVSRSDADISLKEEIELISMAVRQTDR